MKTTDDTASTNDDLPSSRLRLALAELARIDREIAELEQRPALLHEHEPLRSLRACRAVLLRTAVLRLLIGRRDAPKPS